MAGLNGRRASGPLRTSIAGGFAGDDLVVVDPVTAGNLVPLGRGRWRLEVGEARHDVRVEPMPRGAAADGVDRVEVVIDGWRFEVDVEDDARARLRERATSARSATAGGGPLELRAIIPGRVVSVDVAMGDAVDAGGRLLVVEAMKMQNELRATRAGTVTRIAVAAGQTVERGDVLLVLE